MLKNKRYLLFFIFMMGVLFLFSGCQHHYHPSPIGSTLGSIEIVTSPPGANIFLDGEYIGHSTPYTLTNISSGHHIITLILSGYINYNDIIRVEDNKTINLNISLIPHPLFHHQNKN